jgi:hypothetical protein
MAVMVSRRRLADLFAIGVAMPGSATEPSPIKHLDAKGVNGRTVEIVRFQSIVVSGQIVAKDRHRFGFTRLIDPSGRTSNTWAAGCLAPRLGE